MDQGERLNVFSGPTSISEYLNPDNLPPLPLVELPPRLNPLRTHNVRIYAKMLTAHPSQNVKALPGPYDYPFHQYNQNKADQFYSFQYA